jgi:DNA-binding response OmpR family regulator
MAPFPEFCGLALISSGLRRSAWPDRPVRDGLFDRLPQLRSASPIIQRAAASGVGIRSAEPPMRKVLLLEEDATYAAEIRQGLARLGFEVVLLRDGSVGLARAVSERFDLIIISAELPSMNGFRLCNRVKKDPNFGNVPLFLMGNIEDELLMHRQLPTRADDYFKKPVVFAELLARIRLRGLHSTNGEHITDVSDARVSLANVAEMQAKVLEQESAIATLNRDLAIARASATKVDGQSKEVERLRAALADAQRARSVRPPALDAIQETNAATVSRLEKALASEKASADGARVKLAAVEAEKHTLTARARDHERTIAQQKKQLDTQATEAENARKRMDDLSVELVRSRPAMERLREEVAAAKSLVATEQASAIRALATEREAWNNARADLERAVRDAKAALKAREEELSAHAEATSRIQALEVDVADRDARVAALERELADSAKTIDERERERREVTESLSKLTLKAATLADERTRLAERSTKAEAQAARLEQALASAQQTVDREKAAREAAERTKDEEIAAAAAQAAEKLSDVKATLTRAHEQRMAALLAERDAKLVAERRLRQDSGAAWETERKELEGKVAAERADLERNAAAARDAATQVERTLVRERDAARADLAAANERLALAEASFTRRLEEAKAEGEETLAQRLQEVTAAQLEAARAHAQSSKAELDRANARHAKELDELQQRHAQAMSAESARVEAQMTRERAEHAATRESRRGELEAAQQEAERNASHARSLEQQLSDEAAVRAETALSAQKKLADERAAMSKMHVRVLADVRADLELARIAAEEAEGRARTLETTLNVEIEARQALSERTQGLDAALASAQARVAQAEQLAASRQAKVDELAARRPEASGGDGPAKALAEAQARIKDLEDTLFETEALRSFESNARASEYEATISALREKLAAAEAVRAGDKRGAAELEATWERKVAAAVDAAKHEASARHEAELDNLLERFVNAEHDRAQIQASFDQVLKDLEATMAQTRAQLEAELEAHAATRAANARTLESMNAEMASRTETLETIERELDQARSEVPELEAEIVVLRSELLTVRRELDAQSVGARAAGAELKRQVDVLARAEKILGPGSGDPDA